MSDHDWLELQKKLNPKACSSVMWSLRQTMDSNARVMLKHIRRGRPDEAYTKARAAAHAGRHLLRIVYANEAEDESVHGEFRQEKA
jgi:hypothetical protein